MRLIDALPVRETSRIAFVGAGGKSIAMFRLAQEAIERGMRTIFLSATTHLAEEQLALADHHIPVKTAHDVHRLDLAGIKGMILITGELGADRRTKGLPHDQITELEKIAGFHQSALLIEADGARRKALKAPADHEPVIPSFVDTVVVLVGMTGLGQALGEEVVHRSEIFAKLSGLQPGERISVEALSRVLLAETGGLKGITPGARRVALLNQCDTPTLAAKGQRLANHLRSGFGQVILAKLDPASENEVLAVRRRIAGVVLAAGGSVRLGQPKQLLDWHGKPFVKAVARTALDAGLDPVVVVSGAFQQEVRHALEGLRVELVNNPGWQEGQASSVRKAVEYVSSRLDLYGVIFFLVDQPQIPVALVETLLDAYSVTLSPIVAPMIDDRRGNPVLFDQITFDELIKLMGDAGGRQVFSRFPVQYVPWLDASAGLDVDTMEDYRRLINGD